MWSAAIGIAITKAAALAWETKSESALRSKRAQELLLSADATSISGIGGWVSYMGKQVRNFTCGNGGCYTEIIRATGAYGSRIVGLGHLSALRMRRTGDPEYPFIYIDRWGRQHVMRWWQVFNLVDMPDPDEASLGMGLCAAERAYQQIRKLAAMEQYLYEKISGSRPLALHIVNGLTKDQLTDMMQSASENQASKGLSLYMGAIVATTLKPDAPPSLVTIPLAELPNGFEAAEERDRADLIYANALGLDPQDLKPMANQQMGAGAQSEVLNQKAEGRGQAAYRQQLTHMLNQLVFDDKTQFIFTEHDYRDQQAAAAVSSARAGFISTLVGGPVISAAQGLQILVEQGEVPKVFIEQGAQPGSDLSDTDKPEAQDTLNDQSTAPQPTAQATMQTQTPVAPPKPGSAEPTATPHTPVAPPVGAQQAPTAPPAGTPKPIRPITERKALPAHHVEHRSTQAGARRILRQIERKGRVTEKEGVWRTIGGHPVLIGGGGGSGGGKGSGGAKKPAKQYVPKAGGGGSSIYPTLDDYKKGKITHADALVKLKADIKEAKLAGNSKAVNSLTSHYYAMKNKPPYSKPVTAHDDISSDDWNKLAKLDSPSMSEHEAGLAAHNIMKSLATGKINASTMQGEMKDLATKTGLPEHQLYSAAAKHQEAALQKATVDAHKITEAFANDDIKTVSEMDAKLSKITAETGISVEDLKAAAKGHAQALYDTKQQVAAPKAVLPTGGTTTGVTSLQGSMAHTIMQEHAEGLTTADEMGAHLNVLSSQTGVPKTALIQAGKDHHAALQASGALPPKQAPIHAALAGTPIHQQGMEVNDKIKAGTATPTNVVNFHEEVKYQLQQNQMKVDSAASAIASAKAQGMDPLPSIVKMHDDAEQKIKALNALDKNVTATEGLYGVKKATVGGIDPADLQAAVNISAMHAKGTLSLAQYDKTMTAMAKKSGVTQAELEGHVFNAKAGGAKPGLVGASPQVSGALQSAAYPAHINAASSLMHEYDNNKITYEQYMTGLEGLAHQNGISPLALSQKVHTMHEELGGIQATSNASVSQFEHNGQLFTKITTVDAAHDWGGQQHFDRPPTTAEKKAFYDYSYQGDEAINKKLRFNQDLDYPDLKPAQTPERRDANIAHLDAVMARSSVPTNIQVNRGFSNPELISRMQAGLPLEGAVFKDQGFVSTAVSTGSAFGQTITARIRVPKGSKGTYMAQMARKEYEAETELLLPRNSHFKITGYKAKPKMYSGAPDQWEIEMDYLGDQDIPGAFKARW